MAQATEKQIGFACVLLRKKGMNPNEPIYGYEDNGFPDGEIPNQYLETMDGQRISSFIDALKD